MAQLACKSCGKLTHYGVCACFQLSKHQKMWEALKDYVDRKGLLDVLNRMNEMEKNVS